MNEMTNDAAVAWVVVATTEEYGDVILTEYAGTMDDIRKRVMDKARREGFSGHFVERMVSLGWRVEPLALITTVAELRAEIECLRVELAGSQERALMVLRAKDDWMERANKAERRVAAAEKLVRKWEESAELHGVRQFTGNDHLLFANELRAALTKE